MINYYKKYLKYKYKYNLVKTELKGGSNKTEQKGINIIISNNNEFDYTTLNFYENVEKLIGEFFSYNSSIQHYSDLLYTTEFFNNNRSFIFKVKEYVTVLEYKENYDNKLDRKIDLTRDYMEQSIEQTIIPLLNEYNIGTRKNELFYDHNLNILNKKHDTKHISIDIDDFLEEVTIKITDCFVFGSVEDFKYKKTLYSIGWYNQQEFANDDDDFESKIINKMTEKFDNIFQGREINGTSLN